MKARFSCLLFLLAALTCLAAGLSDVQLETAARRWLGANALFFGGEVPEIAEQLPLADADGNALPLALFLLEPEGYLVLSTDTALPAVVAFGPQGRPASGALSSTQPFGATLLRQGVAYQKHLEDMRPTRGGGEGPEAAYWAWLLKEDDRPQTRAKKSAIPSPSQILQDNFITTYWRQDRPFNLFCPTNEETGERAVAGCVPTAIAMIMNYYRWPTYGVGTHTHTDPKGAITGTVTATPSAGYDWEAMQGEFSGKFSVVPTAADYAVAKLYVDLGALTHADWEAGDTSASNSDTADALKTYLRYQQPTYYKHDDGGVPIAGATMTTLANVHAKVREEMLARHPAIVEIPPYKPDSGGHSFIASGLAVIGGIDYYYLNLGWGDDPGEDDDGVWLGWFRMDDTWMGTTVDGAIVGIVPEPIPVIEPMNAQQGSAFTLRWGFPEHVAVTRFRIAVNGGGPIVVNDGAARSHDLAELPLGPCSITVEAEVGGAWKGASDPLALTIVANSPAPLELAAGTTAFECVTGEDIEIAYTANMPIATVAVTCNNTKLVPAGNITETHEGTNGALTVHPYPGRFGYAFLTDTATAENGTTASLDFQIGVKESASLVWLTDFEEAFTKAHNEDKLILLVANKETEETQKQVSDWLRFTYCEKPETRAIADDYLVAWHCDRDVQSALFSRFRNEGFTGSLPSAYTAFLSTDGTSEGTHVVRIESTFNLYNWQAYNRPPTAVDPDVFFDLFPPNEEPLIGQKHDVTAVHAVISKTRAPEGVVITATKTLGSGEDPDDYYVTWEVSPDVFYEESEDHLTVTVTMVDEDLTITCHAEKRIYTVEPSGDSSEIVTVPSPAAKGEEVTMTAVLPGGADPADYAVAWSVTPDVELDIDGFSATFIMPAGNVTVTATLTQINMNLPFSLKAGWNMVYLPIVPDADSITELASIEMQIFRLEAGVLVHVETLTPGTFHWVYVAADTAELELHGAAIVCPLPTRPSWTPSGITDAELPAGYDNLDWNGSFFHIAPPPAALPGQGYILRPKP